MDVAARPRSGAPWGEPVVGSSRRHRTVNEILQHLTGPFAPRT